MVADLVALPFIDEHHVLADAPAVVVWPHLAKIMRTRPELVGRVAACLLGADTLSPGGHPLTPGATLPGFTVVEAVPGSRLVLAGRHRFAAYALTFTLTGQDGMTLLIAHTHAHFPGLPGQIYRALVIGSGAHRFLLTRLLRTIRHAAESGAW